MATLPFSEILLVLTLAGSTVSAGQDLAQQQDAVARFLHGDILRHYVP